jgi:hypothetical protein
MTHALGLSVAVVAFLLAGGCSKKEESAKVELAPTASALEAPKPASDKSQKLSVDTGSSSVKFLMDSPLEKIDGDAPASVSGELMVDLADLGKSTGLLKIDLDKLSLYQQKRDDEGSAYGARTKNEKQNGHARNWLQLVPMEGEVTAEQAAQNRFVEFRIDKLEPSVPNVLTLPGPERKLTATASGMLRLHGRQAPKSAKVELTFRFASDKFESVSVKTLEPLVVELEKFEVHPRDNTGKFVKSITETIATNLKGKIKNEAPIFAEFTAK